jgi:membrane protein DedA with SNARE-associated domain
MPIHGALIPAAVVSASITGQLTSWIGHHGVYAVFVIMAMDALLPVGGELTMLFAGALAAGAITGDHPVALGHTMNTGLESYVVLSLAGTLGYLFGSLVGWGIGRWGGRALLERHGRWVHVTPDNLAQAEDWFDRHGRAAVFLGRLTPVVRSFISIPAGTLESPLGPYTALTLAGSAIWCFGFAAIGWALGSSYESVHNAFKYVDVLAVAGAFLVAIALLVAHRRRRARAQQGM